MKYINIFIILFSLSFFLSCSSSDKIAKNNYVNPCEELRFVQLKSKKVSEMTGEEYKYFQKKRKECEEFNEDVKQEVSTKDLLIALGIAAVVAGLIIAY